MKRNLLAVLALIFAAVTGLVGQGTPAPAPGAAQDPAQQPPVTFRAEVNYVEVDARVLDAQGRFVTGLTAADFELFEDGKPQKVTVFNVVNMPVERAARPLFASQPIEPDVLTNQRVNEGRVYLIVLDDLHVHPLRSTYVKRAARQFIERYVGANDMAAVVTTSGQAQGSQDFTSSSRLLGQAIDKFMGRKLRSSVMERIEEEARTRGTRQADERINDPSDFERGYQARNALTTIKNLSEYLEHVRGRRKALVLFSEGVDYDITDVFNNREATTVIDASRDAIAAATRANVSIYAIDARGLRTGLEDAIEIQSFPDDPTLGLSSSALRNEQQLGQDSLRTLAEETGGFAAVNTNDIAGAFQRVVDDNSSYYVLGYYPTNDRRDGRFRKIEVKVSRPGVTVRARRGYVAPRGRAASFDSRLAGPKEASPELREALSSPVAVSALPLAATAAVFKGPAPNASVVVSTLVGGRDLLLVEKDGVFNNELELAMTATSVEGKVVGGDRNTVTLSLKPDTMQRLRLGGFRIITSIDLPPGRYQLRVAAREANARRAGSVLYDLEIPDFTKEELYMSSLALTSASSAITPTARPKDPLAKLLPGPLTTYREFPRNDEVAVFAEVYDTNKGLPHKVDINVTVKAEGGTTVFATREERDSSELSGSAGGYGLTTRFRVDKFEPGLYVLRVEAQSRIGDRPMVARETVFRVVPGGPASASTPALAAPAAPENRSAPGAPAPPAAPENRSAPGAPSAPAAPGAPVVVPIQPTTLAGDQMSAIANPRQAVAKTAAEFEALWRAHSPGRPVPAVDFSKNMVIAVFLGSRPSSGYDVQITSVRHEGEAMVVTWAERRPGRDQMSAQVMTAPAHLVTVPRFDGAVRFEKAPGE
jgi:VWFA-related protein